MVSINPDADSALADLPPRSVKALVAGLYDLLSAAAGLPAPEMAGVADSQEFILAFASDKSSYKAITQWAYRFGGILITDPMVDEDSPKTHFSLSFAYYGVPVHACADIAP